MFSEKQLKISKERNIDIDRQIHRLTQSYHPLYTAALKILINSKDELIKQQKILNTIISLLIFFLIFYYVNNFSKNSFSKNLILIILSFHLYQGGNGIQFPLPFTLSFFFSAISIIFLKNKKVLALIFFIFSCLLHKIGIVISFVSFASFLFGDCYNNRENYKPYLYRNKNLIILFIIILISCFFY